MTGTVLKNRYCILEQIGKGGNARVYLARDLELGTLRAVKELPVSGKKEARFLASMEHDSLPKMVDYDENSKNCYIIMEYIKGETLGELLRKGKIFTVKEIIGFGISLTQVLEYLHGRKPPVFYGDLKPENLMLSESGKLFLIDLGSAVAGYEKTQRVCMGTEGFAAPEQYEGRISAASDIYGLGRTLEVLTGKSALYRFAVFPGLALILARCCIREEKLRYQDMETLGKKFQKLRRRPEGKIMWILAGVIAMLLLFVSGVLLLGGKKKGEPDFQDRITMVTDFYYKEEVLKGQPKDRKALCDEAEKLLQELLRQYRGKYEYRRIMKLLAQNRVLTGDEEQAALYYEQILRYDGSFREIYGDYGMFLLRTGQKEGAMELWKEYQKKEKEGGLEEGSARNLEIWEKEMREKTGRKGDNREKTKRQNT